MILLFCQYLMSVICVSDSRHKNVLVDQPSMHWFSVIFCVLHVRNCVWLRGCALCQVLAVPVLVAARTLWPVLVSGIWTKGGHRIFSCSNLLPQRETELTHQVSPPLPFLSPLSCIHACVLAVCPPPKWFSHCTDVLCIFLTALLWERISLWYKVVNILQAVDAKVDHFHLEGFYFMLLNIKCTEATNALELCQFVQEVKFQQKEIHLSSCGNRIILKVQVSWIQN